MDLYNLNKIYSLEQEPENKVDFDNWVLQKEVVDYLGKEAKDDYIIIYALLPHTLIHSLFIPNTRLNEDEIKKLKQWDFNRGSLWTIWYSSDDAWVAPPLSNERDKILSAGEQIVFGRSFECINNKYYYELNQKLAHVLDVHYIEERKSWCKLDGQGEIVEVFKLFEINDHLPKNQTGIIICAKKEELSEYISVENLNLIRMFDITRFNSDNFRGWDGNRDTKDFDNVASVYGSLSILPGVDSYLRGFQLVDINIIPKEQIVNRVWGREDNSHKKYCSYIAHDLKKDISYEMSCAPACLSNRFTKSNLPCGLSPAFFKPEVLLKYKNNSEKYTLSESSICCRSVWSLRSFGVNSAGQIHAYLIDLSELPYEEQCYWKQYNERPKAPLSERSFKTDFEGQFDETYDPLPSLKRKLFNLYDEGAPWWTLRNNDSLNMVHYPYTESTKEWENELFNLDQLLIEGLKEKWLRKKAKELGCNFRDQDKSLKLLEVILVALDFEEGYAKEIIMPLRTVHDLRSIKAHVSGKKAEIERKNALREYDSFKKHFEKICDDCNKSIVIITKALKK